MHLYMMDGKFRSWISEDWKSRSLWKQIWKLTLFKFKLTLHSTISLQSIFSLRHITYSFSSWVDFITCNLSHPNIRYPIWVNIQEYYWTAFTWGPGAICDILRGFGVLQGVPVPWWCTEYHVVSWMILGNWINSWIWVWISYVLLKVKLIDQKREPHAEALSPIAVQDELSSEGTFFPSINVKSI